MPIVKQKFSQKIDPMYVWNGNPADPLTSWAKTTTSVSAPEKAGNRGCVILPGLVWAVPNPVALTSTVYRHLSQNTHPPTHPRDSSGLSRSWTVVGKVAVEAVEDCPVPTFYTPYLSRSAPLHLVYCGRTVGSRLGLSLIPSSSIT
jgi:hypothetical protein